MPAPKASGRLPCPTRSGLAFEDIVVASCGFGTVDDHLLKLRIVFRQSLRAALTLPASSDSLLAADMLLRCILPPLIAQHLHRFR